MSSPRHLAAVTSACARPPSTPGPTRFKEISLQNRPWVYELRLQRRAAAARRFGAALPAEGLRLRGAQENPRLARGLERAGLVAARADGPHRAAVLARLRRLRRRRGGSDVRAGSLRRRACGGGLPRPPPAGA